MSILQNSLVVAPDRTQRLLGRREVALLASLAGVITTLLCAAGSWIPSLWGDEATSVISAQRPLPSLFAMLGHVDAVHGTYYLLLHFWVDLFGASPFSVRFPSAVAAGLAIAGVVVLANRISGPRVAVFAGMVGLVLPRVNYMGEEARGYALSAAVATWLGYLLVVQLQEKGRHRWLWLLYAIGVAFAAYVFLFSLLLLVAHAIVVLRSRTAGLRRDWLRATILGLVLALPVIVYGVTESGQVDFLAHRNDASFVSDTVSPWFGTTQFAIAAWLLVLLGTVALIVTYASRRLSLLGVPRSVWMRARRILGRLVTVDRGRETPSLLLFAGLWLLAPLVILLAVNVFHAIYSARYLSFSAPAAALLIGWVLARVTRQWVAVVLTGILALTGLLSYVQNRTPYAKNNSDWAEVSAVMQEHAHPGDTVLFDEGSRPSRRLRLAMYTYPQGFAGLDDITLAAPAAQTTNWYDATFPLEQVASELTTAHTVWLLEYKAQGAAPDTWDRPVLAAHGFVVRASYEQHSSVIYEYVRG